MARWTSTERQTEWKAWQRRREEGWRGHLAGWRQSGTSQAEYCRRHDLAPADFSYWKHELARRDGRAEGQVRSTARFIPVQIQASASADIFDCEVVLKNGRRLRLGATISAQRVAELATVLENPPSC